MSPTDPQEDFRLLWSLSTEEIRFFKSQQYTVTNYALALYAALYGLRIALGSGPVRNAILTLLAILVAGISTVVVYSLQTALWKARRFGRRARRELSPELTAVIRQERLGRLQGTDEPPEWRRPGDVVWTLIGVIVSGAGAILLFLWVPGQP